LEKTLIGVGGDLSMETRQKHPGGRPVGISTLTS
jgi:hypothetical protein